MRIIGYIYNGSMAATENLIFKARYLLIETTIHSNILKVETLQVDMYLDDFLSRAEYSWRI